MKKKVYIMGGAQTDFERNWTKEGKNMIALLKEAIEDGFKDAEFTMNEMVALNTENRVAAFVGNFIAEQYISQEHLGAFLTEVNPAFYGVPSARYEAACASSSVALDAAISKIEAQGSRTYRRAEMVWQDHNCRAAVCKHSISGRPYSQTTVSSGSKTKCGATADGRHTTSY